MTLALQGTMTPTTPKPNRPPKEAPVMPDPGPVDFIAKVFVSEFDTNGDRQIDSKEDGVTWKEPGCRFNIDLDGRAPFDDVCGGANMVPKSIGISRLVEAADNPIRGNGDGVATIDEIATVVGLFDTGAFEGSIAGNGILEAGELAQLSKQLVWTKGVEL